jgi:hypothetical protein
MGGMVMGKCEDGQREFFYDEINCEHFQGWYGGLQFGNVYTFASLKKLILEHFFTSLLKNLSREDLLTLGNLLSTNSWIINNNFM